MNSNGCDPRPERIAKLIARTNGPRMLFLLLAAGGLMAQTGEHPISSLPYTPSLDLSSMDRSVEPCVNFYNYSCGNWIKRNPIPPDQSRWSVYSKLTQDNEMLLWGILVEAAKPRA